VSRDGQGFRADLIGLGIQSPLPGNAQLWITAYGRYVEGGRRDVKTRLELEVPFQLLGTAARVNGYEDIVGSRPRATEWSGLWQLLFASGRLFHRPPARVEIGLKWFNHARPSHATSAPLLMVRWGL
jgi:hypothetical protein